jgi:hypothetical protein
MHRNSDGRAHQRRRFGLGHYLADESIRRHALGQLGEPGAQACDFGAREEPQFRAADFHVEHGCLDTVDELLDRCFFRNGMLRTLSRRRHGAPARGGRGETSAIAAQGFDHEGRDCARQGRVLQKQFGKNMARVLAVLAAQVRDEREGGIAVWKQQQAMPFLASFKRSEGDAAPD